MPEMEYSGNDTSLYGETSDHPYTVRTGVHVSEIEEVLEGDSKEVDKLGLPPLASIKEDRTLDGASFRSYGSRSSEECVYVGVGKGESSMDALTWTLRNEVEPAGRSTIVYLVHVFPEIRSVPTPLGNLPKSRVNPEQLESFMAQERGKRRELLQKFLNSCHASNVKIDTILIESDMVAKAILDLIPVLDIRKLVLGISKSGLRKLRTRKASGVVDQIRQNVPESCDLKIICEGKQVTTTDQSGNDYSSPLSSQAPSPLKENNDQAGSVQEEIGSSSANGPISCMCFRSKFTY